MKAVGDARPKIIWGNLVFLVSTPILAAILVPLYLSQNPLSTSLVLATITLWVLTGLGITAGYHRLFSHRSYKAEWPVRLAIAVFGGATWQNSIVEWCSDHRRHHRNVDTDDDPYNAQRGFWWSHIGWVMFKGRHDGDLSNVKDLLRDPICAWQHKHYLAITGTFNIGVPVLLGLWFDNVWGMLLFAGLLRVVLVHHFTFLINSLAHISGTQPWSNGNSSRDSWALSFLTFGEGYHNYHHAFESDYRNGRDWYAFDPSKWLIWALSRIRLAYDLRRIPDDMIIRRRFEEQRSVFVSQLDDWGHRLDLWREEVKERAALRASQTQDALRVHLVHAEERLETALVELKSARTAWQSARRANQEDSPLVRASRRELRALKQSMRNAQRTVQAAMDDWEQRVADCSMMLAPVPV